MRKSTLIKVATQSILKNKMRTFLTMLGIVIGVAAVIVMVAVGYGAQESIQKRIAGDKVEERLSALPGEKSYGPAAGQNEENQDGADGSHKFIIGKWKPILT